MTDILDSKQWLEIPIRGSDEVIQVKYEELPDDAEDITDILKAEMAPLALWIDFAVAYYKQGKVEPFKQILLEGAAPEIDQFFADSKKERIAILNTLASYYISQATKQQDKGKKDELFAQATSNFSRADKIDIKEDLTWVGKGVMLFFKGDNRAIQFFDNAIQANPTNAPAFLGKACILYNNGQYEEALNCYKSVIQNLPNAPATVRLGMGYCFYKLNKLNAARKAFQRTLQLDSKNAEALLGLALLERNVASAAKANSPEAVESLKKAMYLLNMAYQINPENSMVLIHLADHHFFRQDFEKAYDFSLRGYHNTDVEKIKAEACYQMARACHAQNDYEKAFQYYSRATQHWPEYPLAQFGLAQMHLHRNEREKAVRALEVTIKLQPDHYEALKTLGSLLKTNNAVRAYACLRKVTEIHPGDVETWIEIAQLPETKHEDALEAYEKARVILEETHQKIPTELWNNIGVLRHILGNIAGAEEAYLKSLESAGTTIQEYKTSNITTIYNLARLHEKNNNFASAEELYKGILKEHSNYIDCYLRLGCMAKLRGLTEEATNWFKESFTVNERSADAWTLIGNLHLHKEEWQPAQKKFEKILENDRRDPYAMLSMGNIYYAAKFENRDKEEKYLQHAMDFYWKVLQLDSSNLYAANGVGIIFAERGQLQEAKDFFVQVREATNDMPDVWVNLAHVYLAQGQYINAIKMYQNCLKKFYYNKDPTVMLFLSRAFFEANRMDECRQTLMRAIHITPQNKALWFNVALTFETSSVDTLKKERKTVAEVKKSLTMLGQASQIYDHLQNNPGTHSRAALLASKAEKHAKYCTSLIATAKKQMEKVELHEKQQEAKEAARREVEAAYHKKVEAEREAKRIAEENEKRSLEAAALEFQMKADEMLKKNQVVEDENNDETPSSEKKKRKSKRGGKKKDMVVSDSEEIEYMEEDKEEDSNKSDDDMFGSDDDNNNNSSSKKKKKKSDKKRRKSSGGGDEDRSERKKKKKDKKSKKERRDKKKKKNDFIVNDDDLEEEEGEGEEKRQEEGEDDHSSDEGNDNNNNNAMEEDENGEKQQQEQKKEESSTSANNTPMKKRLLNAAKEEAAAAASANTNNNNSSVSADPTANLDPASAFVDDLDAELASLD